MPEPPEVSVVVPTRDRWPLLRSHALSSALSQREVELELIVVDDGSADGTASALGSIDDPRLRVVRHESSLGVSRARNRGLGAALGEWVAFLDDDDLWAPDKLRRQLDAAHEAGADFVYCAAVVVDAVRTVLRDDVFVPASELPARIVRGNVVPGGCSNVLARTELVRRLGGFDEELSFGEDWDLWIRLAAAGRPASLPAPLVAHVEHPANTFLRDRPDVAGQYERVLRKHGGDVSPAAARARRRDVLEWLAREYKRSGRPLRAFRTYLALAREQRSLAYAVRALGVVWTRGLRRDERRTAAEASRPAWLDAPAAGTRP